MEVTNIITEEQKKKVEPLFRQVIEILGISFGEIKFTVVNRNVYKIFCSDESYSTYAESLKNNKSNH